MSCLICQRIYKIKQGVNPYFVKELKTGYVVLGDHQYCEGYTLFLFKEHKTELHQLDEKIKMLFLKEFALVAEAVYKAFKPKKLNYELMGNSEPHMHWHIFPRKEHPSSAIWAVDKAIRQKTLPPKQMDRLKAKLLTELNKVFDY